MRGIQLILFLFLPFSNTQNQNQEDQIVFRDSFSKKTKTSTTTTTTEATAIDDLFRSIGSVTSENGCKEPCLLLEQCPQLHNLLEFPDPNNLAILRKASCGFSRFGEPKILCPIGDCSKNKEKENKDNLDQNKNNQFNLLQILTSSIPDTGIGVGGTKGTDGSGNSNQNKNQNDTISINSNSDNIKEEEPNENRTDFTDLNDEHCGIAFPSRISGGVTAAKGEMPWQVGISIQTVNGPQVICGGALISETWVVTAAHCTITKNFNKRNISFVRVGAFDITNLNEEGAQNIGVEEIFFHPEFKERPVIKNDIALLKLKKRVKLNAVVGTICIPDGSERSNHFYEEGKKGTIAGWGSDGVRQGFNLLQKVQVPIVSGESCKRQFYRVRVRILTNLQICAGETGKDSCKGDSGGGLMMTGPDGRMNLIGVISFGTVSCDGRLPGVYTKISSYYNWIKDTISNNR